ncbi:hypothetical protein R77569_01648 [Ralstonia mannitolilytica]|uniref:Integrase n=1 Tax=Ralstonia mannitolilytica TaxID=105219 RepID=A0ABN9K0T7_9RALS|nr:hypothetical protein [Ralstonia mannitolilytica]CAJ0863775.1 hypothetical protein R77569_01648 [Ralstonia mannitolilytica]
MQSVTEQRIGPDAPSIERESELASTRNQALQAFSVDSLQRLDSRKLTTLQHILRHGDQFGVWVTPREWVVPGTKETLLSIDLRRCIVRELHKHPSNCISNLEAESFSKCLDQAVLVLTRYLLLLRLGPAGMGRGQRQPMDPSTIFLVAYWSGPALLARAIAKQARDPLHLDPTIAGLQFELPLLHPIGIADLAPLSKSARGGVLLECKRMQMLSGAGLWWDVPSLAPPSTASAMAGPAQNNEKPDGRDSHLPLPDGYVAEMGRKSLWLMRNLAPNLLTIAEKMTQLWEDTASQGGKSATIRDKRAKGTQKILAAHRWLDSQGGAFSAPPFPLQLPRPKQSKAKRKKQVDEGELRWPPRNYRDIKGLLSLVQTAHYFIAGLSMGPRRSECLGLQRDCVAYAADGRRYANGKTYKLVQRFEGKWRDWLLPDAAVDAIEQQLRIVTAAERIAYIGIQAAPVADQQDASKNARKRLWAQLAA